MYPTQLPQDPEELRRRLRFAVRFTIVLSLQALLHLLIILSHAHAQGLSRAHAQPGVAPEQPKRVSRDVVHMLELRREPTSDFAAFAASTPAGVEVVVQTIDAQRVRGRVSTIGERGLTLAVHKPLSGNRDESFTAAEVRRVELISSRRAGGGGGPGARIVLGGVAAVLAGVGLAAKRSNLLILGLGAGTLAGVDPEQLPQPMSASTGMRRQPRERILITPLYVAPPCVASRCAAARE